MLTQKESTQLQDMIAQEKLCIEKYDKASNQAKDPQLKELFKQIKGVEQQHYNTLSQIHNGNCPCTSNSSTTKPNTSFKEHYSSLSDISDKNSDKYLCSDTLDTEKHVSSVYNTGIFEFTQTDIRDTLNHIQKEEQEHGEAIDKYMKTNSMC